MVGRAVGVVLAVICAGAIVLGAKSSHQVRSPTVTAGTYDTIKVGQTEREVSLRLPQSGLNLRGAGGRRPVGSQCRYYRSPKAAFAYRFCFTGGKLVEKKQVRHGSRRQQPLLSEIAR